MSISQQTLVVMVSGLALRAPRHDRGEGYFASPRNDGGGHGHVTPPSRGADAPGLLPKTCPSGNPEGAGNAGCARHPRSHAQMEKRARMSIPAQRRHPGIPCTMVYGLFRALPGDRLCCHRRLRVTRRLDASIGAPGPHGFAVRKRRRSSATPPCVHRIPRQRFATTMIRPSRGAGRRGL